MSRKTPLSSQTKKLNIVIRKNKDISIARLKEYCNDTFSEWAFIEHRGDIEPVTKLVEGVHYHIVGNAKTSRVALSTRLNTICQYFHFDNADGVEIEQYISFEGSLQYLIHKNQPEKTQHDISEIITNLSPEELTLYLTSDIGNVITFDRLYASIMQANNIIDVIHDLGIKAYKDWRNVIWDIWNCDKDIRNEVSNSDYLR